jgi:type II pantothenate kinase
VPRTCDRLPRNLGATKEIPPRDQEKTKLTDHGGLQIGGTLAKLVYFTRELNSADNGGRLNFLNFETHRIDLCINFIRQLKEEHEKRNGAKRDELCVVATGGGAYKYYERLKEELGVNILREEEMECLIIGEWRSSLHIGEWL